MAIKLARRLLNVYEYNRMREVGILTAEDHVELINGEIIEMSPIGSNHAACVKGLTEIFYSLLAGKVTIGVQDPIHLNDLSEPEPDISILNFASDRYANAHPKPEDVIFLVEVAETSISYDQEIKLPLYAQAGIPEVWIVNVELKCIEIYTFPTNSHYTRKEAFNKKDSIQTELIPILKVSDVFV